MWLFQYLLIGLLLGVNTTLSQEVQDDEHALIRDARLMVNYDRTWPKAIVPYVVEPEVEDRIPEYNRMIAFVEARSCVRFTPWDNRTSALLGLGHQGHIKFFRGTGCASHTLGFNPKPTGVHVSCCGKNACLHEMGHVLGFFHEQTSPRRDGWIRANPQNILPDRRNLYARKVRTYANTTFPYDFSSLMHYTAGAFTGGQGPAFTRLFHGLFFTHQKYYFFMEMAAGYRCHEKPPCNGKILKCENDGYQSVLNGKCACMCPPGLDADNLCRTPLKKVTTASWPKGQYALPKPVSWCPSGDLFAGGSLKYHGLGKSSTSQANHLKGVVTKTQTELHFCTKATQDTPPGSKVDWNVGNFCVYQKGGACPEGFVSGSIHHNSTDAPITFGSLPDGVYGNEIEIKLCCSWRGFHEYPLHLPTDKPFYLFKHPDDSQCQEVQGMRFTEETFTLSSTRAMAFDPPLFRWKARNSKSLTAHLCYYSKLDMDCGGVITLSRDNPEQVIEMSARGRTDLQCTWVIRGETSKGNVVLDFEDISLKKDGDVCRDRLELRYARIGQIGHSYKCVSNSRKNMPSTRSILDKMMIRFFTIGRNSQSSFKAKVRWTANEDMCYNVDQRGANYDGRVNYTRFYRPCLPWADMTHCQHHPFAHGDTRDNLVGTACRNPDHSFRPWCYTDREGCVREYCDVCSLERPYDRVDYCDKLRKDGFCVRDASQAVLNCAKTCMDLLPTNDTMKKSEFQGCGRPTPPSDSTVTDGPLRSSYRVGQTVQYTCNQPGHSGMVTSTCLTSGRWSDVGASCQPCPPDHHYHDDTCYKLLGNGNTVTYDVAVTSCTKSGGVLAVPRSLEEADVISAAMGNNQHAWIAVTDRKIEGKFRYQNGHVLVWTNWDKHEPNDKGRHGEDCVAVRNSTKWFDIPCSSKYPVVCGFPAGETSSCADVLGEQCQSLLADRPTTCVDFPPFAKRYCRKTCGFCTVSNTRCQVTNHNPNVLTLARGESTIAVGAYVNYQCDRFKYRSKGHESRACLPDGSLTGEPLECGECPVGFTLQNNTCHGLLVSNTMATFSDSQRACKDLEGFLAMPKTREENTLIAALGYDKQVRLGLTDGYTDGFVWQDGVGLQWSAWATGYPKPGNNHCVVMRGHRWYNVPCDERHTFFATVCTIPKTDDDLCYDTEDGGVSYDGHANYTQTHQPCVPWTQVTSCPHHAFNNGDEQDNLEENYCRNPDNSYRPWCYTDSHGCKRDFCDVCGTGGPQRDRDAKTTNSAIKKYSDIRCGPPLPPADGVVVGWVKRKYRLGETVEFKCKTDPWTVYSRCMTSGQWSQTGFACLQSDCVGTILDNTCYHTMDHGRIHDYHEAVAMCKAWKGVIATPRSRQESELIRSMGQGPRIMLGITDVKEEGTWRYQDGSKVTWTNWARHEPLGGKREQCAAMVASQEWADFPCTNKWIVVCARPKKKLSPCQDFLVDKCPRLLEQTPTMCRDHKGFASVFCTKTCQLC